VLKDVPMADPMVGARAVPRAGEMAGARVALKAGARVALKAGAKVGSMGLPWAGQWDLWGSRSTTGQSIPEGKHARERTSFFVGL